MSWVQSQLKEWSMVVLTFFESLFRKLGEYVPNLFGAVLVILTGLIVAKIFRRLARKVLRISGLAALGEKVRFNEILKKVGIEKGLDEIMAALVYYIVIMVFIVSASEILGIKVVLETLNRFIVYLPHVLGAFIILVITLFVAKFIKDATASALSNLNIGYAGIVSSSLEIIVAAFGILMALNELGFEMTVFTTNITIIIAGVVLAVVLSIGLGSRSIMSNILARYYINQLFSIGDEVTLAGRQGKITRITPVSVVLKTEKGEEIYIPNEIIIKEGSIAAKSKEG
jgi:small-conductance mechanosensitive channel